MKKILALMLLGVALAGCNTLSEKVIYPSQQQPAPPSPAPPANPADAERLQRRFSDAQHQQDAVQTAVEWAKKYEQLLDRNLQLQEQTNNLLMENNQLKMQLQQAQEELARTQKELDQTNQFLGQLHGELSKWKTDVLGFRDEMRQAQLAQLEALRRIMQILGAEPVAVPPALEGKSQ